MPKLCVEKARASQSVLIKIRGKWLLCGFTVGLSWSDTSILWQNLNLVRPVGAGECELLLNVPRQCWAGGFICSDRFLTVCDDERQLRVAARHWPFSWQCELWRPKEARACISRPSLLLILPSKVLQQRPQSYLVFAYTYFKHRLQNNGGNTF